MTTPHNPEMFPERFKPLPYGGEEDMGVYDQQGVHKFFNDPDFAHLILGDQGKFGMDWATELTATEVIESLSDFSQQAAFRKGSIALRHTFARHGTIIGGANLLKGDVEDILDEVRDNEARTVCFEVESRAMVLAWGPMWKMTFHDLSSNQISLRFKRQNSAAREILDQCMAATALPDLRDSIDITLDELGEYQTDLARK